jgi:hypothetical protein
MLLMQLVNAKFAQALQECQIVSIAVIILPAQDVFLKILRSIQQTNANCAQYS